MDGIHDLGGMEGFGPVDVAADAPFTHDWERRMWALARTQAVPGMTIDRFRHAVERMVPADYLTYNYFAKWCTTYLALYAEEGVFTLDEIASGHTGDRRPAPAAIGLAEMLELNRTRLAVDFERPAPGPAGYAVGDLVRTRAMGAAGHTRLPRYARGREGTILAHHGAHVFADTNARGEEAPQHLYTVVFAARELWGPEADPRDRVTLDLYESYLEPV